MEEIEEMEGIEETEETAEETEEIKIEELEETEEIFRRALEERDTWPSEHIKRCLTTHASTTHTHTRNIPTAGQQQARLSLFSHYLFSSTYAFVCGNFHRMFTPWGA